MSRFLRLLCPSVLVLLSWACSDQGLSTSPEPGPGEPPPPSQVILDGSQTGFAPAEDLVPGVYFLPPIGTNPEVLETFDAGLADQIRYVICRLDEPAPSIPPVDPDPGLEFDGFLGCEDFTEPFPTAASRTQAADVCSGGECSFINYDNPTRVSLNAEGEFYEFKFQERKILINRFHRMFALLDDVDDDGTPTGVYNILGYVDLFPTAPELVPSVVFEGVHVFRWGSTEPLKLRIELGAVCSLRFGVADCDQELILCADGGQVETDHARMIFPAGSCAQESVLVTLEELDLVELDREDCFQNPDGTAPLDLPLRGTCITLNADLANPDLLIPAILCIAPSPETQPPFFGDPSAWQVHQDEAGQVNALANAIGPDCDGLEIAAAPLPDSPLARYATLGLRRLRDWIGPRPLEAGHNLTSFVGRCCSDFSWAGLAKALKTAGDQVVVSDGETVTLTVRATDFADNPMPDVRFALAPLLQGDVVSAAEVFTDADGFASVDVTYNGVLEGPVHGVTFTAVGLQDPADFDAETHFTEVLDVQARTLTFTATVVGPASSVGDNGFNQGQTLEVDAVVDEPLRITVGDGAGGTGLGNLLEGQSILWTVDGGLLVESDGACGPDDFAAGGSVQLTLLTGSGGTSATCWKLGTTAGEFTATATVLDELGNPVLVDGAPLRQTYTVNALPAAAAALAYPVLPVSAPENPPYDASFTGDFGKVAPGGTLLLLAEVRDPFGNARVHDGSGGDAVSWSVPSAGEGTLLQFDGAARACTTTPLTGSTTTGTDGIARACWGLPALNAPAPLQAQASATFAASPLPFRARPTCEGREGLGTAVVGGGLGADWVCANQSGPWSVSLSGGATDARLLWMNDDRNLYLALEINSTELNEVRFDFNESPFLLMDGSGDPALDAQEDGLSYDPSGSGFSDEYLTAQCLNRSQSGCGSDVEPQDGSGGHSLVGGKAVYEIAHPLASGDARDFDLAPADRIGFFWTIQGGNGAKGNTQIPQFRDFRCIQIAGEGLTTSQEWVPCEDVMSP